MSSSSRTGVTELWLSRADGSSPRQLTNLGAPSTSSPRWSPDGKQIAFDSNKDGKWECYVINPDGGSPKRITDKPSTNFSPRWSRDGRWLYFTSDRAGQQDVWKMPAAGGTPVQVTHHGGGAPVESPDGRFLYYAKQNHDTETSLWRTPFAGGAEEQVAPAMFRLNFSVTDRGIYYAKPDARFGTIEYIDAATGHQSTVHVMEKPFDLGISISPDGRYLLFSRADSQGANLMLMEDFK